MNICKDIITKGSDPLIRTTLLLAAVALLGLQDIATAATSWQAAPSGTYAFETLSHWTAGVPDSADVAYFYQGYTYNITFAGDAASSQINLTGGDVTFDLNGHTYALSGGNPLFLGSGTTPKLTVTDGTMTGSGLAYLGYTASTSAILTFAGADSNASFTNVMLGNSGTGTLNVESGATGSSAIVYMGFSANSPGNKINITDGGTWSGTTLYVAYGSGSSADVLVSGTGSSWTGSGATYVGGNAIGSAGTGSLTIDDGGSFNLGGNNLVLYDTGTLTLGGSHITAAFVDARGSTIDISHLNNTITGGVTMKQAGHDTEMHLASDADYAHLTVTGVLTLAGTLDVHLDPGYQPSSGDLYDLFDWGTLSGTFSAVNLPDLTPGLAWDDSQLYTNGTIQVVPEPASAWLALTALGGLMLWPRRRRSRQ